MTVLRCMRHLASMADAFDCTPYLKRGRINGEAQTLWIPNKPLPRRDCHTDPESWCSPDAGRIKLIVLWGDCGSP